MIRVVPPLDEEAVRALRAGDEVLLSGVIYTGRDAAHRRLADLLERGGPLPVDLRGQILYFTGPTPAPPGRPAGSAGPTTSSRMDAFSPLLIRRAGLRGMIGKGDRSPEVVRAMREGPCVYFAAVGGAGALLGRRIRRMEVVAWPDLGPEAMHRLEVEDFPLIVAIDAAGVDLYETGPREYRRT